MVKVMTTDALWDVLAGVPDPEIPAISSISNSSGTKRHIQSRPSAIRLWLSPVPSPRRITHSALSSAW